MRARKKPTWRSLCRSPLSFVLSFTLLHVAGLVGPPAAAAQQPVDPVERPLKTGLKNPDAVAVLVGIGQYQRAYPVPYAVNDLELVRRYLIDMFGYEPINNILTYRDSLATAANLKVAFAPDGGKVAGLLKGDRRSDIFFYFSGHGFFFMDEDVFNGKKAADPYLVPYDWDPGYVRDENTYSMQKLRADLAALAKRARSVTVVMDACFSGQTVQGPLVQSAPRAQPVLVNFDLAPETLYFSATSKENKFALSHPEKKHGLFTYYFLAALNGKADGFVDARSRDGSLTALEIEEFLKARVPEEARRIQSGFSQNPEVTGDDKGRVLIELPTGELSVESTGADADLWIDERPEGRIAAGGRHTVRLISGMHSVRADGGPDYKLFERSAEIGAQRITSLVIDLVLTPEASIRETRTLMEKAESAGRIVLPAGESAIDYSLTMVKTDPESDWARRELNRLKLAARDQARNEAVLSIQGQMMDRLKSLFPGDPVLNFDRPVVITYGKLLIHAGEGGGQLSIDGKPSRELPPFGRVEVSPIESGSHTVSLTKPGFPDVRKDVVVRPDDVTEVRFEQPRIPSPPPPPVPPPSGRESLGDRDQFDFDSGVKGGNGGDVMWIDIAGSRYLIAQRNARMAVAASSSFDSLSREALSRLRFVDEVVSLNTVNALASGLVIGVKTASGQLAKMRLDSTANGLRFTWAAYR